MAGTVAGGKAAAATNIRKYGKDFYHNIGKKGGKASGGGGFAYPKKCDCSVIEGTHLVRQCAGAKGGTKSRR
jgi:general stress protein YciG